MKKYRWMTVLWIISLLPNSVAAMSPYSKHWCEIELLSRFRILLPNDMRLRKDVFGIDSYVVAYSNRRINLTFEYGDNITSLPDSTNLNCYESSQVEVDDRRGQMISFCDMRDEKNKYSVILVFSGVTLQKPNGDVGLNMDGQQSDLFIRADYRSPIDKEIVTKILKSIIFATISSEDLTNSFSYNQTKKERRVNKCSNE